MTPHEEIEQLKIKIAATTDKALLPALLVELLAKHAFINSTAHQPYVDQLLQLAEVINSQHYKAWALFYMSSIRLLSGNYADCISIALQAALLFEQDGNQRGVGNAYNNIGVSNHRSGNYTESEKYHLKALEIWETAGDKKGIADSYNNIGNIYEHRGDYTEALKSHLAALKIRQEIDDRRGMAASLTNMGTNYCYQGNYAAALKNWEQALEIVTQSGDKHVTALLYSNMGVVYKYQQNNEAALKNQLEALRINEEMGSKEGMATTYNNLGVVYFELKDYTNALECYFKGLAIYHLTGDKRGILACYSNIGEIYSMQNNYTEALKNQLIAYEASIAIGNKELIRECALALYKTYKATGDLANALHYHEKYHEAEKAILGEQTQKQLTALSFQHNLEQKEKEAEIERLRNVELKDAMEQLKMEKVRAEQLLGNQVSELKNTALQAQMNPHFVFNSLNAIQRYIWKSDPEKATDYLASFAKLIRLVLENSRYPKVSLERDLQALDYYIQLEALRFENEFKFEIICNASINKEEIMIPPMILQPYVENAIIHGLHPSKKAGKLVVALSNKDEDTLQVIIEDNGVGRRLKERANSVEVRGGHKSLGMEVTQQRLEKVNGERPGNLTITDLFDTENLPCGTRIKIELPI